MFSAIRFQFVVVALCLAANGPSLFGQANVMFDVPAIARAKEASAVSISGEKTIEIVLPISTASNSKVRGKIEEFRFDVSWNQSVYNIEDFHPKTETAAEIQGLVNVKRDSTRNATFRLDLNSEPFELASAGIASELGRGSARHETFQEIPQHELLVASGTINRATGAFFRFHPSRTQTLEGSRELKLTYRVPADWQSGILKVECRAKGKRALALWNEPFEVGRSFVVPVFQEQNSAAQKLAIDFAKAEQDLRKAWSGFESKTKKDNPFWRLTNDFGHLPEQWPHLLIQSGNDQYLSEFEGYLTQEVAVAAGKFVQARRSLGSK